MVKISVVIPVYNGAKYLAASIRSVLEQSFTDFEVLVIDDGSTDDTEQIVHSFPDKRIRYIKRQHDYIASLNYGMEQARAPYIARMDADDMMHPDRLRIQYNIMEQEPTIDICGTWFTVFQEGNMAKKHVVPTYKGLVKDPVLTLLDKNILCHPSVLIRKSFLLKHHLSYEPEFCYAEDYRLWMEAAKRGAVIYVEPTSLLYYRISDNQICMTQREAQRIAAHQIREDAVAWLLQHIGHANLLHTYYKSLLQLEENELIDFDMKMKLLYTVLNNNKCLTNL